MLLCLILIPNLPYFFFSSYNKLREKFPPTSFIGRPTLSEAGFDLLNKLLTYDPEKVIYEEKNIMQPFWLCLCLCFLMLFFYFGAEDNSKRCP